MDKNEVVSSKKVNNQWVNINNLQREKAKKDLLNRDKINMSNQKIYKEQLREQIK